MFNIEITPRLLLIAPIAILSGIAIALLTVYLILVPTVLTDRRRRHLPPGPSGLPFVGNLFDLVDTDRVKDKVVDWHQKYGPVYHTKIGATDYIWLSSPQSARDLLDKRSSIYSSRAPAPFAQDVASGGQRQLFMAYGKDWRAVRKVSHSLLNAASSKKYQPVQDLESRQLLCDLLDDPDNFYEHNRRYSSSVIMTVAYGYRLPTFDHPLVTRIYTVLNHLTDMMDPGAHPVDSFPALAKLPQSLLGNWRSQAEKMFRHDSAVYLDLWRELKRKVDEGTANECFCRDFYLSEPEKNGVPELLAAYTCGGLVEAGSETTSTTLNNFLVAMLLYPDVMRKAQKELDNVVGSNRLPTWEDEQNLPYVRALVKEMLRWRPVNKFGMPHYNTADDWYEGMFIPKGSVIMLNWWAIHLDETLYKNATDFNPDRFLSKPLAAADYLNVGDPLARDHWSYGAGRRVCPGIHVAEASLFINIARTLWAFDIGKAKDAAGQDIEPDFALLEMVKGFLSQPKKFKATFSVRSASHEATIRREGMKTKSTKA